MKKLSILILLSISTLLLCSQTISSLGTDKIQELECIQSSITNTFIASSMEIYPTASDGRTVIHRSIDNGITWTLVETLSTLPSEVFIADPVLAIDSNGVFYLVHMRVLTFNTMPPPIDLELYKSEDDGLTWEFVSKPYDLGLNPDYPQIVAKGDGELYLVYSLYITDTPGLDEKLIFKKSVDKGVTWSEDYELLVPSTTNGNLGPDISWGENDKLHVTVGGKGISEIYHFESTDYGSSWSNYSISNIPLSDANLTKPISHNNYEYIGILSHKPHNDNTMITYHSLINGAFQSLSLENGAYAQGYITDDGNIHVIYNQMANGDFFIKYIVSENKGLSFSNPTVLYSSTFDVGGNGEYQSLVFGNDGKFYLTFLDWGDNAKAKMLVFAPQLVNTNEISETTFHIYPNPLSDKLFVDFENSSNVNSIKLMDLNGKILRNQLIKRGQLKYDFNISNLNTGAYIVLVEESNRLLVQKVIKIDY